MSRPLEKGRAKGAGWIPPRRYENEWETLDVRPQPSKVSKSQTGIASYILAALPYDDAPHHPRPTYRTCGTFFARNWGRIDPSTQSSLVLAEVVADTSFLPAQDDDTRVPLFAGFWALRHILRRSRHHNPEPRSLKAGMSG